MGPLDQYRAWAGQAVDVPPGLGVVTWRYTPPGFLAGLALSLVATTLICAFVVLALFARRARKPSPIGSYAVSWGFMGSGPDRPDGCPAAPH